VRNDTGVFEGGEISTFYDPMIAKLCTWAPTRLQAIDAMAVALDSFEVEGVGNNLPFLSTVMDQERFREGRLTTGYIAEEFPQGFHGAELGEAHQVDVAAAAAIMMARREQRRSGTAGESHWHVQVGDVAASVALHQHGLETLVDVGWRSQAAHLHWQPGDRTAQLDWSDGRKAVLKVTPTTSGFRIRYRGADLKVQVLRPHVAALLKHMPVKVPPDMSRYLLCPMPGQVVRIDVAEGDVVEDGQTLAVVEAMKMENVLKAEKRARVSKVHAAAGAVLAVDAVILEFEAVS
jgi:propionyl-CoA carboxylase alpha chain